MGKLSAIAVKNLKEPGTYSDGEGLILRLAAQGRGSWLLRVQTKGKRRDIGLGTLADVSLAQARESARDKGGGALCVRRVSNTRLCSEPSRKEKAPTYMNHLSFDPQASSAAELDLHLRSRRAALICGCWIDHPVAQRASFTGTGFVDAAQASRPCRERKSK